MNGVNALLQRYEHASNLYSQICCRDPSVWHRPDTSEFTTLRELLTPFAEDGEMRCQYALDYEATIETATRWWIAAASQGHYCALDNLIVCGVGAEADRVRGVPTI